MPRKNRRPDGQAGTSLTETLVATAIVGMLAVILVSGVGLSSHASLTTDQQSTAQSLAASQMEWVKANSTTPYVSGATQYAAAAMPTGKDYTNFSVTITAAPLRTPDDGIQKITVIVRYNGVTIDNLEDYKLN